MEWLKHLGANGLKMKAALHKNYSIIGNKF